MIVPESNVSKLTLKKILSFSLLHFLAAMGLLLLGMGFGDAFNTDHTEPVTGIPAFLSDAFIAGFFVLAGPAYLACEALGRWGGYDPIEWTVFILNSLLYGTVLAWGFVQLRNRRLKRQKGLAGSRP